MHPTPGVAGFWDGDIPTGGMNATAKTLGAWHYRGGPAFANKSGHTPNPAAAWVLQRSFFHGVLQLILGSLRGHWKWVWFRRT